MFLGGKSEVILILFNASSSERQVAKDMQIGAFLFSGDRLCPSVAADKSDELCALLQCSAQLNVVLHQDVMEIWSLSKRFRVHIDFF